MPTRPGIIRRKSEEQPNHPCQEPQDARGSAISQALYTFFYIIDKKQQQEKLHDKLPVNNFDKT